MISTMFTSTILLITSDRSLMESVKGSVDPVESLELRVIATVDQVGEEMAGDVSLIIAHLEDGGDASDVTRLVRRIAIESPGVATLVVDDSYQPAQALAMLRLGAADYLTRPLDLGRLGYLIEVLTLRARRIGTRPVATKSACSEPVHLLEDDRSFLYLPSTKMGRMMEQIKRVAPQDTTILLGGETGTGKSRLAGLVHRLSARRGHPFLTINCGALSSHLIESEMFGHVKGSFTGADSDRVGKFAEVGRGTLFLDEVDSLPAALQAKLLRAVEERVFEPVGSNKTQAMEARLIAASNRPLDQEVAAGRFRSDLFYRLNVVAFTVPPLRDRPDVVPHLVRNFLAEFDSRSGHPSHEIGVEALDALEAHDWPGNLRELRNVIERAVALCPGHMIHLDDLPDHFHSLAKSPRAGDSGVAPSLAASKVGAEKSRIAEALEKHANNKLRAAAELGISRMTLYNKLRKYGLSFST
jgi:DNA-binding NtrC family response regulator